MLFVSRSVYTAPGREETECLSSFLAEMIYQSFGHQRQQAIIRKSQARES